MNTKLLSPFLKYIRQAVGSWKSTLGGVGMVLAGVFANEQLGKELSLALIGLGMSGIFTRFKKKEGNGESEVTKVKAREKIFTFKNGKVEE